MVSIDAEVVASSPHNTRSKSPQNKVNKDDTQKEVIYTTTLDR